MWVHGAGDAKLLVRGALLGAAQNASVLLTDFPMAMLQPIFRAMPALQHAAPAVSAGGGGGGLGGGAFPSGWSLPFRNAATAGGARGRVGSGMGPYNMASFANSPVNGMLYVRGTIGAAPFSPMLLPPADQHLCAPSCCLPACAAFLPC